MGKIDEIGTLHRIDYGDRIFFDSVLGIAGTTYPIGTADMPSDVIANAIAICVAQNINKINVVGILPVDADIAQDLVGHNMTLTAQTAGNAYVREISGYLEIDAMVGGTLDIYAYGAEIQINADCAAGTINIYGVANVTVIAGATVTVNDYTVPYQIDRVQGGAETLESLDDELDAILDLAGGDALTLDLTGGAELTLYEYPAAADMPGTIPFYFAGLKIDWTGLFFGAGENTSIRFYELVDGVGAANLRLISTEVFLVAALPVPVVTFHPRNANTDIQPTPGYYRQGIRITAQQAAVGGGWNTLTYCRIDAVRGS